MTATTRSSTRLTTAGAARQARRVQRDEREAVELVDLGLGPQHFVQPRDHVDLHADLVAPADEIDAAAVAGAREREDHAVHAVGLDEPLELVRLAEVGRLADVIGERVVIDEADHADAVLGPRGELLDDAARDAARTHDERRLRRHQPAAHDHARERAHRGGEDHERDEEDGKLPDRRLLHGQRGIRELPCPGGRRGEQHEARDIVGGAVRHAQLVLRVVAVQPRERDPGEQPAEHERRVREGVRARVERPDAERGDHERGGVGDHEAATQEPPAAPRLAVTRGRQWVLVETGLVVGDRLVGNQRGNVRACPERRCRHACSSLPAPLSRGVFPAESCTNLRGAQHDL